MKSPLATVLSILILSGLLANIAFAQTEGEPRSEETTKAGDGDQAKEEESKVNKEALMDPKHELMTRQAPDEFRVIFDTTQGSFIVEVKRAWAPNGADRFYNLVDNGYYDGVKFFRVIEGFMAQFGINGDPEINAKLREAIIADDPVKLSNTRGTISFATRGPNSRTTQLFINYGNNERLDRMGFSPFAKVIDGIDVVDKLYADYGEGAPRGRGPSQGRAQTEGNEYLEKAFPKLDAIKRASIDRDEENGDDDAKPDDRENDEEGDGKE